ncbi:GntR family transcriptional regulator [Burkholderia catarinensis]|uniref:GntR family transcriptional regulator n=1 Tax=Burkholderia catarinensis TaxID=1108140 RepID=UPI000914BA0D|nr:GntR family transcriptional regulator [Burkholderia catarinensis]KAG8149065.1 GntR family transcriptional regulator [Burkholderia catarinensis]
MRPPTTLVAEAIREDILRGELPPGTPLIQENLSAKYGVSRIPIREALVRLKADGLARQEGKRGLMVAPLQADEAEDLWMMRSRLEPLALEMAFPFLTKSVLGEAEDLIDEVEHLGNDPAKQSHVNWLFHRTLYEKGNRQRLLVTLDALHMQADRYLRYQYDVMSHSPNSRAEHMAILGALRARDLEHACTILARHIEDAGRKLVAALRNAPAIRT